MEQTLSAVQESIHYRFRQVKFLQTALTHSSYANEFAEPMENNERLEFLGDAVLELVVSEELYKRFPGEREGKLTRIRAAMVNQSALARLSRELKLDEHLLLGKGEEQQGGRDRDSLLCDVFEAVLGAVFLDQGFEEARNWALLVLEGKWPQEAGPSQRKDYKSRLQEVTQRLFHELPKYTLTRTTGPEHDKCFEISLRLPGKIELTATGGSLKRAEQEAARLGLKQLKHLEDEKLGTEGASIVEEPHA